MDKAALAELVAAAETGDTPFPVRTLPGLRGEAARLDNAERMVFAEGEGLREIFAKLTELPTTSPLRARAERLRLLRKNREKLKSALNAENPYSGRLIGVLAAGPGPTLAKRYFEESLAGHGGTGSVIALRRALARSAFPVYQAERTWLKKVGPSSATTRWERFKDRAAEVGMRTLADIPIILAFFAIMAVCVAMLAGAGVAGVPVPIGAIIFFAYRMFRRSNNA